MKKKIFLWFISCLFVAFVVPGCTTSSRSTKTETTTTETEKEGSSTRGNEGNFAQGESSPTTEEAGTTKTEKRTEVKENQTTSESRGVLGTTLHFIGQVLAFPFKVIARVIEFIF